MKIYGLLTPARRKTGFALVVTISLMVLLTILAVALLSLSSVSLRTTQISQAKRVAQSNARLALMMAIGELQRTAGDDRRVTADASILDDSIAQPDLVGVWRSAPSVQEGDSRILDSPGSDTPDYGRWKDRFEGWLVSHPDPQQTTDKRFAQTSQAGDETAPLFELNADGIEMEAAKIPIRSEHGAPGALAWGVSQEATRTRINVGDDEEFRQPNDAIHAPSRPNLSVAGLIKTQPDDGWTERNPKLVTLGQAALETEFGLNETDAARLAGTHTATSRGVLANVVDGGLKTDLSLAFELDDGDFQRTPLHGGTAPGGERPLYEPGQRTNGRSVYVNLNYDVPMPEQWFDTGAPPTFNSLRSYYRMYHHMYQSAGGVTAFSRPHTSVYYNRQRASAKASVAPPAPRGSETGVGPVLDRILYVFNFWKGPTGYLNLVITPIVTLWNPNNVAVEAEGFVVYPWMDMPFYINASISGTRSQTLGSHLSVFMGSQYAHIGHGRQDEPYFLCRITQDGSGTASSANPVVLRPGEVRVFVPSSGTPTEFIRTAPVNGRVLDMMPATTATFPSGGMAISLARGKAFNNTGFEHPMQSGDRLQSATITFDQQQYHFFTTLEDAGRMLNRPPLRIAEMQLYRARQIADRRTIQARPMSDVQLAQRPQMAGVLEIFHRTASGGGNASIAPADITWTINPRQRFINATVSNTTFAAAPHYDASFRPASSQEMLGFQTTPDGQRAYYGDTNSAGSGRDRLSFFEFPRTPMMSLGGFQTADLADTTYAPGIQFGNSWASPYLPRNAASMTLRGAPTGESFLPQSLAIYDHSYLLNAALWDGFFFSSIAPEGSQGSGSGGPNVYNGSQLRVSRSMAATVQDWVSGVRPLRNTRHILHLGGKDPNDLAQELMNPEGVTIAAAHMLVDGAFNVNSTREEAWASMLASLRSHALEVLRPNGSGSGSHDSGNSTPFPRLSQPTGQANDPWEGFRELTDNDIEDLAEEIVEEVRRRGPFQSLGEFVNRRLGGNGDDLALKGALQAAIDNSGLNNTTGDSTFDVTKYPQRNNLAGQAYTRTAAPGWLTQGDLLNGLGPFITVRSDTFTIRGYGEAHDGAGNVIARSVYEAIVQRLPEWVDAEDEAHELPSDYTDSSPSSVNGRFGRRFSILSIRELSADEIHA